MSTTTNTNTNGVKRSANSISSDRSSSNSLSPPPEKKSLLSIEPLKIEKVESAEDLDIKVLRIQNQKLSERLESRQKLETELREKIVQLENRKTNDDAKLCIFDRYWTQLDDDLMRLLERFDTSNIDTPSKCSSESVRNYLLKLIQDWDKSEIESHLKERVKFTTQAIGKLVCAFDKTTQKQDQICRDLYLHVSEFKTKIPSNDTIKSDLSILNEQLKTIKEENTKLNCLVSKYQQEIHNVGLQHKKVEDEIAQINNQIQELRNQNEEYEYQIEKSRDKIVKLERSLSDALSKSSSSASSISVSSQNSCVSIATTKSSGFVDDNNKNSNINDKQLNDLQSELNEQRELAANRLIELEKLSQNYQQKLKEIEKLKVDLKSIPASEIEQSIEYRHLQTKYSVIVNDNVKMKQALDETRNLLEITRSTFQRQIEQMESAELSVQKQLGNEIVQLNEQLTQLKRDNDSLRIEYEQNMAANEQTGPINKEMRSLITTLQTNNKLLKSDNTRLKKKLQEVQEEYEKYKNESVSKSGNELDDLITSLESICDKIESNELKESLKKVIETLKNLKNNQKTCSQASTTPSQEKPTSKSKASHSKSSNTPSSTDGESSEHHHVKKIKHLEDQIRDLQRNLNNKKLEEAALLNDMEITGQAFEDVKEQNTRLMQQLREKDDANFKLMSERLKLENMIKLTEEKLTTLAKDCEIQKAQSEKQLLLTNKLEEQCIYLQQSLAQVEKELSLVQQTCEQYKKSAYEQAFTVQELKLHIHKYSTQLKETQNEISEKAESLAAQVFNNKRLQEEIKHLQLKLERQKKFESASNIDEVLREENREYKEQLRCPSCKVKQKDAVLTKCFHVFCYDCLQKRYELRQRKCPKCNANFGQNDFRKLYLS